MKTKQKSQELLIDSQRKLHFSEGHFQRILVAINSSDLASSILEKAILIAQEHHSHLILFYCLDSSDSNVGKGFSANIASLWSGIFSAEMIEYSEQLNPQITEEVLGWLRSRHKKATDLGIPTEFDYAIGDPGKAICQLGKSWGADMVILGQQQPSGLAKFFSKSVSQYVLSHAGCSVMTVTSDQ